MCMSPYSVKSAVRKKGYKIQPIVKTVKECINFAKSGLKEEFQATNQRDQAEI